MRLVLAWSIALLTLPACAFGQAAKPSSPAAQFVTVEPGVKLEVLDLGGHGRPLVLLAGLGGTAHSWGAFSTDLAAKYHVYAITRRGYGNSDAPDPSAENYAADRLGDDILAVMDVLKIDRPVLIGHSLAGEELSSIGTRHPERVAGLIYLDAGYIYALSSGQGGEFQLDTIMMREHLNAVLQALSGAEQKAAIESFERDLTALQKDFDERMQEIAATAPLTPEKQAEVEAENKTRESRIEHAILFNELRYLKLDCPVLAIFAAPHEFRPRLQGDALAAAEANDLAFIDARAKLFRALPDAKVVLIPHADHAVFKSNESDVLREIDLFAGRLR